MATVSSTQARIEKVLVEATMLLVGRARAQLEREVEVDPSANSSAELRRLRELEEELLAIREGPMRAAVAPSPGPQLSRYYDVPGQEDS